MKIACVDGGPAGLYFALLMKLRDAKHDITVIEWHEADQIPVWGLHSNSIFCRSSTGGRSWIATWGSCWLAARCSASWSRTGPRSRAWKPVRTGSHASAITPTGWSTCSPVPTRRCATGCATTAVLSVGATCMFYLQQVDDPDKLGA